VKLAAGKIPSDGSVYLCCSPERCWYTRVTGAWLVDGEWVVLQLQDGSQPLWAHADELVEVAVD
jgi:hypothetical protein